MTVADRFTVYLGNGFHVRGRTGDEGLTRCQCLFLLERPFAERQARFRCRLYHRQTGDPIEN